MKYNNRFFETEQEAKAFQKEHGGHLLHVTPRSRLQTRQDFAAEVAVAYNARGEIVYWDKTPYCVAWNER